MPKLTGDRIILRAYVPDDLDAVHQWMSDPETMRFLSWGPTKSKEETFVQLADFMRHQFERDRQGYYFAVVQKSTGQVIGHIDLRWLNRKYGGGEGGIGYFLSKSFWGQGYMTEAAKLTIGFGFCQLGMHRISASCIRENIGSERVMQKSGMTKEAEYRKSSIRFGKWTNRLGYAILREEWEAKR